MSAQAQSITPTARLSRSVRAIILAVIAIALVPIALPQLYYPLGFDQAVYAACGYAIRNGGVPIRDCFETKQMGVMVMYAIPMRFTMSPVAIHALSLAWVAITAIVIGWVTHRLAKAFWPGVIAAALYWLIYAGINYWSMDQAETFANLFLALAFYWLWKANEGESDIVRMVLAGVCIGISAWFKYVFGLMGIALGIAMLVHTLARRPKFLLQSLVANALAYALGVLAVIGLGIGYYALNPGGLDVLLQQLSFLRANFPLAEPLPPSGMLQMMLRVFDNGADRSGDFKATVEQLIIFGGGFPLIFVLAAIGLVRSLRGRATIVYYLLMWFAAAVAIVIWQGNYIQYHYFVLWPPIAMLAGLALSSKDEVDTPALSRSTPQRRIIATVSALIALAAVALLVVRMWPWMNDAYINVIAQRKPLVQLYEESYQAPIVPMARYLRENSKPSDRVAIFGDAPWVYTLAERNNATRFSFVNVWIKKRGTPNYDLMVQQYFDDLQRTRPLYFLLTKPNYPWQDNDYIEDYKQAQSIYNYVEANYKYEAEIGEFLVFKRK